ncbi:MAG: hypothetical protein V4738_09770 [Pseudomonadota bacterium]
MNPTNDSEPIKQDRLWADNGWTARVIKNEDDDGWAVAMTRDGEAEPALVGPWTMGRDKKNPKPLDTSAFNTLVKTAAEVVRRHEQQAYAQLNKNVSVTVAGDKWTVALEIVPDEFEPYALLKGIDALGSEAARARVRADFKLTTASATAWIESGWHKPV